MDRETLRVLSRRAPTLVWYCPKCHQSGVFECTELFRANANGKLIDIWLTYRCRRCDHTKNLTVVERTPVHRLPAGLLDAAQGNDGATARRLARDLALIRANGTAVAEGDEWDGDGPARPLWGRTRVEVVLVFPEPLLVRLDAVLAATLGVSRAKLGKLVAAGAVTVRGPGRLGALRLWSDVTVDFRFRKSIVRNEEYVPAMDLPEEPPVAGTDVETLLGALERQRRYIAWKCGGLDGSGLRATLGPSTMTLGGLLKHLALVEADVFSYRLHGRPRGEPWDTVDWDADPDWEWRTAADDDPDELMRLWRAAAADRSRALLAEALATGGLDTPGGFTWPDGRTPSARRLVMDTIEEYARHVGHADLLRESVDGLVGEDPVP